MIKLEDALGFMHLYNTAHLDFKEENILRTANGDWVLADFGSA